MSEPLLSPLNEARQITDKILILTQNFLFTAAEDREEEEMDGYVALMAAREPLVNRLTELKKEIDSTMESSLEFEEIQQTIAKIAEIDNTNLTYVERMREAMQEALRKIKGGQKIHKGYTDTPAELESRSFDIRH